MKIQPTFDSEDFLVEMQSKDTVQTTVFFKGILALMLNYKEANLKDFYEILSIFIKKYEVFKRIFPKYSSNFIKRVRIILLTLIFYCLFAHYTITIIFRILNF